MIRTTDDFARERPRVGALLVFRADLAEQDYRLRAGDVPKLARRISDLDYATRAALVEILRDPSPELAEINELAAETIDGLGLTARRALADIIASGATGGPLAASIDQVLKGYVVAPETRSDAGERRYGRRVFPLTNDNDVWRADAAQKENDMKRADMIKAIRKNKNWKDFDGKDKSDAYVEGLHAALSKDDEEEPAEDDEEPASKRRGTKTGGEDPDAAAARGRRSDAWDNIEADAMRRMESRNYARSRGLEPPAGAMQMTDVVSLHAENRRQTTEAKMREPLRARRSDAADYATDPERKARDDMQKRNYEAGRKPLTAVTTAARSDATDEDAEETAHRRFREHAYNAGRRPLGGGSGGEAA